MAYIYARALLSRNASGVLIRLTTAQHIDAASQDVGYSNNHNSLDERSLLPNDELCTCPTPKFTPANALHPAAPPPFCNSLTVPHSLP